jgi:hypothetical protein
MLENFYKSINFYLESEKPQKLLYIGKIYGEYFFAQKNIAYFNNTDNKLNITNIIIKEDLLKSYEDNIKNTFFNGIIGTYQYLSFTEAYNIISENKDYYDMIFIDTVHYKEYIDMILKKLCNMCKFILMHDAVPLNKNYICDIRNTPIPWCGTTYIATWNLHLHNPNNVYIVNDNFVGYCFIKTNNSMILNYNVKNYELDEIINKSMLHEEFYKLLTSNNI